MKRKTQKEFLKEVAEVSPNIEVIGDYKDRKTKLWCRCKKCGYEWEGTPTVLLRKGKGKEKKGGGCPKCAGVMAKTHEEFMTECQRKNPKIEIISEYKGANREITCRCKKCGLEWKTTPHVLLSKAESKCPNEAENRRKTTEEFRTEMKLINPSIEIIGEYINAKTAIECHCKLCGHEWISTPDNLRGVKGCPACVNIKLHKERYMGQAEFERRLQKCNPGINVLGTYINTATRIQVQCKKCGNHWSPYAGDLLRGYGCSKCAGNIKIRIHAMHEEISKNRSNRRLC
mgnify:CR=1 FL=1